MWNITRIAIEFFRDHLPYWTMQPHDELLSEREGYCFADPGSVYAVYLKPSQTADIAKLDLSGVNGLFQVHWLNVVDGGPLQAGDQAILKGGSEVPIGNPPSSRTSDWVALIKKK